MAKGKADPARAASIRRWVVFRAADQLRAEGKEWVALRNVWARVKRNAGVAGANKVVSDHC